MARSTGFEPAISSVTGRRDNPFTTSARTPAIIAVFTLRCNRAGVFVPGGANAIITDEAITNIAAVAQLVERRFRKA